MKKIITLLFAALAFGAVHAQSREEARKIILGEGSNRNGGSSERSRDIILGDGNGNESSRRTYPNSTSGTEAERINRDYDSKINSIRNNPNLSSEEKARIIRQLENDRDRKIRQANDDYRNNDSRDKKNKKYKSNNGKHKGWTKGKGNKHGNRDDD